MLPRQLPTPVTVQPRLRRCAATRAASPCWVVSFRTTVGACTTGGLAGPVLLGCGELVGVVDTDGVAVGSVAVAVGRLSEGVDNELCGVDTCTWVGPVPAWFAGVLLFIQPARPSPMAT